eukprot:TRINITY_DN2322_c0_g1_i2.p1 TRINITY_DN2322_c0_g1~~TRINITY_DN2322_c0_g1_i2.p1  ORF type:complete len:234 (+),score=56.86 TRINITY_DN2322_c0_g1_i2:1106-1807(+)
MNMINNRDNWVGLIAKCSARILQKPDYLVKRARPIDNHLGWRMFVANYKKVKENDFETVKFLTLFAILYGGTARFSEIANRRIDEIALNERSRVIVKVPRTKTAGSGCIIECAAIKKGFKGLRTKWLVKRLKEMHGVTEGLMFPSSTNINKPISNETANSELQEMLKRLIKDDKERKKYTSHGFRRGAATKLFKAGCRLEVVMKRGRWRSAEACRLYLQLDCEIEAAALTSYQ